MCGIAGILRFDRGPVAYSQIKAMTDAIAHRGPDGEGQFIDEFVGLGHRRLAILDLSSAGHQPMQTQNGRYTITYNGEVYNFNELRIELEALGYMFHSNTDTEVVLNAYAEWGAECLKKFNGMFAFAIWDKKEHKFFLARDRYGIKPLYYHQNDKEFVFASEIKGITASGLYNQELNKEALVEYLTFQNFFKDRTLFKNIKLLSPGHFIEISSDKKIKISKYWDFNFQDSLKISENDAIEEIDRLFNQAIQRQLISDVPVNSYLSGGIDSGAITMVSSKYLPHLRTFTIGFDLSSISGLELSFDERVKAEHISSLAKTEHYEMVLKAGDMERCMDKYVWHLEEPRVGQSYPNYYAAMLASKFGKVVLSGTGGDELFGGYPWRYYYSETPKTMDQFIDEYYLKWQRLLPNARLKELLGPIWNDVHNIWTRDLFADVFEHIKKPELRSNSEFLNASFYFEAKTFLPSLLVVEDKLSMAHGLETRVPFLDNDLVDFALKVPSHLKLQNVPRLSVNENELKEKMTTNAISGKYILRKTLGRYLDESITNNKKQGFSAPDSSWFKGESLDYIKNTVLSETSVLSQIFDLNILKTLIKEHTDGLINHRLFVWSSLYLHKVLGLLEK